MGLSEQTEIQIGETLDALDGIGFIGIHCENADHPVPRRCDVVRVTEEMMSLILPECFRYTPNRGSRKEMLREIAEILQAQISAAFLTAGVDRDPEEVCRGFLSRLPDVKRLLALDVQAMYEGDPAALSPDEVLLCYPGLFAISVYRLAHELFLSDVPMLPRMMTEHAHEKTGIDIHPGATIGRSFFIDHGTGIVIGETTVIGDRVKIYQGVTLGAKSFPSDENGLPVKKIKRHPDIGNDVTIYANATILGGDTVIGDGCVIGGNTWLTHSVESGRVISRDNRGADGEV